MAAVGAMVGAAGDAWGQARPSDAKAVPNAEGVPAPRMAEPDPGARFRFGVGGTVSLAVAAGRWQGHETSAVALNPGLMLDLGVQVNQQWAVYVHGMAGSLIFWDQEAAYGIVEWSPHSALSLGTGLGCDAISNQMVGTEPSESKWWGLSLPVLIAWNVTARREDGSHLGLRVGLEGGIGVHPTHGVAGGHTTFTLSYVSM